PSARFPWGGQPLQFPDRALVDLTAPPDRPLVPTVGSSPLADTAGAISADLVLAPGFGSSPVDGAILGFRAYYTHLTPSQARNFVFPQRFPSLPPNPFARGRPSGCTGCHMLYARDGHSDGADAAIRAAARAIDTSIAAAVADDLDAKGQRFYPVSHKL